MDTILGIDLGTTNSAVSVIRDGTAHVLEEDGEKVLPSVVGLDAEGKLLVGTPARNQWTLAPDRTVRSIKRKMGSDETIRLADQNYTPQEVSAMILRTLKQRAARQLGGEVKRAVITVPAFFNEQQREATREAGELAGLEVVRIINEPTAASLTYNSSQEGLERLLVYDLGGGTFDVSIVQIEMGVVEVLSSHGDTQLGGDDFDELLLDHVCDQFQEEHGVDLRESLASKSRVLRAVEEAKQRLSFDAFTSLEEEFIADQAGVPLHLKMELQRLDYETLIEPLLSKTLVCVDEALSDAKLTAGQIDRVILVGGASRTPLVHRLLTEQLGQPIHAEIDPDLCVTMGAAIQGGLIAGMDLGPVLVDITPHTLGVQCRGSLHGFDSFYAFAPLINRNTALPASRSEVFGTQTDGQERVIVTVLQGEHEDARHNDM
ncbi:MAG: Hsp70 family protein, partial [Pirellulaceae bacterium]